MVRLLTDSKPGKYIYNRPRRKNAFSIISCKFTVLQLVAADIIDIRVEEPVEKWNTNGKTVGYEYPKAHCKLGVNSNYELIMSKDSSWEKVLTVNSP